MPSQAPNKMARTYLLIALSFAVAIALTAILIPSTTVNETTDVVISNITPEVMQYSHIHSPGRQEALSTMCEKYWIRIMQRRPEEEELRYLVGRCIESHQYEWRL